MSTMLEQIDEIEKTAREIVRRAQDDKQVIESDLNKMRTEFENELHDSTRREIEKIRKDSEIQMETLLDAQNLSNKEVINTLEERFGKHEKEYAANIVRKIIEV